MTTPEPRSSAQEALNALETHMHTAQRSAAALRGLSALTTRWHQADHPLVCELEREELAALLDLIGEPLDESTQAMHTHLAEVRRARS